jgi:hypothetical protein
MDEQIVNSIHPSYRNKARNLLEHMLMYPNIFQWTEDGNLVVNGRTLLGSNKYHLVHFLVQKHPSPNRAPRGSQEFIELLKQTHVPMHAMGGNYKSNQNQGLPQIQTIPRFVKKHPLGWRNY